VLGAALSEGGGVKGAINETFKFGCAARVWLGRRSPSRLQANGHAPKLGR
jgi:hypothetical protein